MFQTADSLAGKLSSKGHKLYWSTPEDIQQQMDSKLIRRQGQGPPSTPILSNLHPQAHIQWCSYKLYWAGRSLKMWDIRIKEYKLKSSRYMRSNTMDHWVGLKQRPAQLPSPTPQSRGETEYVSLLTSEKKSTWSNHNQNIMLVRITH